MAIAFDAASNSGFQTTTTPYSWSHTCTGSNRLLTVGIAGWVAGVTVTGITYNGVALTKIRSDLHSNTLFRSEMWALVNPASGSNTITVTWSGAPNDSLASAISLTGVDQTTPNDADNGATGGVTTDATATITTVADNAWLVNIVASNTASATWTVGAGQTQVLNTGTTNWAGASYEGPVTPAGATVMNFTVSGGGKNWATSAASFKPAGAGGGLVIPVAMDYYRRLRVGA